MSNKDPDQRLTPDERDRLVERHYEEMLFRKRLEDLNHDAALRLGRLLKRG